MNPGHKQDCEVFCGIRAHWGVLSWGSALVFDVNQDSGTSPKSCTAGIDSAFQRPQKYYEARADEHSSGSVSKLI